MHIEQEQLYQLIGELVLQNRILALELAKAKQQEQPEPRE